MLLSIIVPVYNEEKALPEFYNSLQRILKKLPYETEIWFVNDGSTDRTSEIVRSLMNQDAGIGLLELSRNFGHQAALTAGLDFAEGDVVISMDGDGQHPPERIPEMLSLYKQGFDVVLTQRQTSGEGLLKRWTSSIFYKLINFLSETPVLSASADFRLLSRKVVLALRQNREHHRFLRGLIPWLGFRRTVLSFDPPERIAGTTKYSVGKMLHLASDAIFSFSTVPMKLSILLGCLFFLLACGQLSHTLYLLLSGQQERLVPGWTTLIFCILGGTGVQLVMLGILGQYVGKIFQEVKRRPLYLLQQSIAPKRSKDNTSEDPAGKTA